MSQRTKIATVLPLALAVLTIMGATALAQIPPATPIGVFEGRYKGSYQIPDTGTDVQLAVTLVPDDSKVKMRWTETLGPKGEEVELPRVFEITGLIKGPQLRFSTPRASLFPRTTYNAVRWGQDLLVHLRLYAHPEGFYNDESCEPCEEVIKEIKLVRE
jgi:hypothetical protein